MSYSEKHHAPAGVQNKPIEAEHLLNNLRWRYAVKKFDAGRKIAPDVWRSLEHATIHAPSSFGLQPWKFIIVSDPAIRQKLREASWNQSQITDASHLVVFARLAKLSSEDVDRYVRRIAEVRGVEESSLTEYRNTMTGFALRPNFDSGAWAARQVYIALGVFLTSAAMLGVDTCPMEGIDPAKYDEILGLGKTGFVTQVVATAGYRAADDAFAQHKKVRFHERDVIVRL
ncbi:MAG: NAD(P)H-dependent oxidoreductase [Planctomycetes bacterium]|nr:NAD(P)H-dependent oxidoreductase [Planctomycetota bacterium]